VKQKYSCAKIHAMTIKKLFYPIKFIREVKNELELVVWPSHQESTRLTIVVIAASIITGVYLGALDIAFTGLFSQLIKK